MDQVRRQLTKRRVPLTTKEWIEELNPIVGGWDQHYKRAHVRKLFNRLDRWIVRRIWPHRFRRWRNCGWKKLPVSILYREYRLCELGSIDTIFGSSLERLFVKAGRGKAAHPV